MAKKTLPYFEFHVTSWDNGNIQICSRESKGLFLDICSMYWSRMGHLPYKLAMQKLFNGNANALQELMQEEILCINDEEMIVIEFLDEQLDKFQNTREERAKAAKKRWEKQRLNEVKEEKSVKNAKAMQLHSKSNASREEKRREEKRKTNSGDFFEKTSGEKIIPKKSIQVVQPKILATEPEPSSETITQDQPYLHEYLEELCGSFNIQVGNPSFHTPVRRINGLLKKIEEDGQMDYFKKQVEYYFKLKELNVGEKICRWMGWFGINDGSEPIWKAADYESVYLREKQTREFDKSNKSTPSRANHSIRNL